MESIEIVILVVSVIASAIGSVITWYWGKRKFKEFKEAQDAQEQYYKNKK